VMDMIRWEACALNVWSLVITQISKVIILTCGILNLSFSLMYRTSHMIHETQCDVNFTQWFSNNEKCVQPAAL
jgi:fumarate reductase subunit D